MRPFITLIYIRLVSTIFFDRFQDLMKDMARPCAELAKPRSPWVGTLVRGIIQMWGSTKGVPGTAIIVCAFMMCGVDHVSLPRESSTSSCDENVISESQSPLFWLDAKLGCPSNVGVDSCCIRAEQYRKHNLKKKLGGRSLSTSWIASSDSIKGCGYC